MKEKSAPPNSQKSQYHFKADFFEFFTKWARMHLAHTARYRLLHDRHWGIISGVSFVI